MDVSIDYDDLEQLSSRLDSIISEFDNAEDRADRVEEAIGDPFGRNDLREAVEDFEDRWNHKRGDLRDALKTIRDNVDTIIEEFRNVDKEAGESFNLNFNKSGPKPTSGAMP